MGSSVSASCTFLHYCTFLKRSHLEHEPRVVLHFDCKKSMTIFVKMLDL